MAYTLQIFRDKQSYGKDVKRQEQNTNNFTHDGKRFISLKKKISAGLYLIIKKGKKDGRKIYEYEKFEIYTS